MTDSLVARLREAIDTEQLYAETADHLSRQDSVSLLRRCGADRKILDAYKHADRVAGGGISPEGNYANGLEFAVRCIAEAYGVEA